MMRSLLFILSFLCLASFSFANDVSEGINKLTWISNEQIAERIHFEGEYPEIVLAVGPSRSSTTALARLMAEQGVPTWYQPIKAILRNLRHGNEVGVTFSKDTRKIFIKETLGAYSKNESLFDPLDILLKAGVPPEKIKLVIVLRDPLTTAASAMDKCSFLVGKLEDLKTQDGLIDVFLWSYENLLKIEEHASSLGIETISFVYEAYRDNKPVDVAKAFFKKIGFDLNPARLEGWRPVNSLNDFVMRLDEPAIFHTGNDLFVSIKQSYGIKYSAETSNKINILLSDQQIKRILNSGIYSTYGDFIQKCRADLNVQLEVKTPNHISPASVKLIIVKDASEDSKIDALANHLQAVPISKELCRKALIQTTKDRNLDEQVLDSGSDLLVSVFAEHFLKYGHSVIVNNITPQDPKNMVWEGIKSRTNASMHFIEEIPDVTITTKPKDDLKMVMVCGLPGTGKTTLVESLAKHFNMLVLPKELTELAIKESTHDSIPSDQVIREGGYYFMAVLADYYLSRGYSVIMDGVTPKQAIRDMWQDVAIHSRAKPYLIETICSNATLHKERLEQRVRGIQIRNLTGKVVMWHEVSYDRYLAIKSIFEEVQGKCLHLDSANNLKNNISSAIQFIGDQAAPRE